MRDDLVRRERRRSLFAQARASVVAIIEETPYVRQLALHKQGPTVVDSTHAEPVRVLSTGVRLNDRGLILTASKPLHTFIERADRNPAATLADLAYLNFAVERRTPDPDNPDRVRIDTARARLVGASAFQDDIGVAIFNCGDPRILDDLELTPLKRPPT